MKDGDGDRDERGLREGRRRGLRADGQHGMAGLVLLVVVGKGRGGTVCAILSQISGTHAAGLGWAGIWHMAYGIWVYGSWLLCAEWCIVLCSIV